MSTIDASPTQRIGNSAESTALDHLQMHCLTLVTRNYRTKMGEIDLILRDKESLVFVEVRARTNQRYGGGLESVTRHKQRKLIKTASFYLMSNPHYYEHPCRFDVVEVRLPKHSSSTPIINWIPNAFDAF